MRISDNTKICITLFLGMLIVGGLAALGARHVLQRMLPPTLATIELTRALRQHQEHFAGRIAHATSEAERQSALRGAAALGPRFEQAIAGLRAECGCVLLLREAVVAGEVPDLTARLAALVDDR